MFSSFEMSSSFGITDSAFPTETFLYPLPLRMKMKRGWYIIFVLGILLLSSSVSALWVDISGVKTIELGDTLNLYHYRIKAMEIDTVKNETDLKIYFSDKDSKFEKTISEGEEFEASDFKIVVLNVDNAGGVYTVQIVVYEDYSAEIIDLEGEQNMQLDGEYTITAQIHNDGAANALFKVDLIPSSGFVTVKKPSRVVRVDKGDAVDATYDLEAKKIEGRGQFTVNVYYENSLVDTHTYSGYEVSGNFSGSIKNIKAPTTLRANEPALVTISLASDLTNESEFTLDLRGDDFVFETNPLYVSLPPTAWTDRQITLTPTRAGNLSFQARLYYNDTLLDWENYTFVVKENSLPEITAVDIPEQVQKSQQFKVHIGLNNPGDLAQTMRVRITGLPDNVFIDQQEQIVQLDPGEEQIVTFSLIPDVEESFLFTIELLRANDVIAKERTAITITLPEPPQTNQPPEETPLPEVPGISPEELKGIIDERIKQDYVPKRIVYQFIIVILLLIVVIIGLAIVKKR